MTVVADNDRAVWLEGPSVACSHRPEKVGFPWRLVLLGAPGVGKGTQASLLNERLGACHLSTGDVFRAAAARGECVHSPAMAEAMDYIRRGALVPDTTVWEMVRERGECLNCPGGFILDGFPRTLGQAEALQQFMEDAGLTLTAVVNYAMPLAHIVNRLGGRRVCQDCKAIFHVESSADERKPCDHCGGILYQREDDRPESIKVRMQAYESSTAPLIQYYEKLGLLVTVDAAGSPEEIFGRTAAALEGKHQS